MATNKRPNNLIQYGRNVGRSLVYTSVDVIKEMNPVLNSFAETNGDLTKEAFKAVKDYKETTKKVKHKISENQFVKSFNTARKNFLDDLKTGNWYNKEREDSMMDFDDEDDWEWSDESDDSSSLEVIQSDTDRTISELNAVSQAATDAIAKATMSSADYTARVINDGNKSILNSNKKHFSEINLSLSSLNSNMLNLVKLGEPITTHINNSASFYTKMTNLQTENNQLLKEILKNTKSNNPNIQDTKSKNNMNYDDLVDVNGVLDFRKYGKHITNNLKKKFDFIDMLSSMDVGDNNILDVIAATPISELLKEGMKAVIPKSLKKNTKNLNQTLSDTFSSLLLNLNTKANDYESPEIFRFINDILGVNLSNGKKMRTDMYEKGKVDFDGITRKSIIEVIPTYLSKILSAVSGEEETRYDYNNGKFVTVSKIKGNKKNEEEFFYKSAVRNFKNEGIRNIDKLKMSKDVRETFEDDFDIFLKYLYDNSESFNYKDKNIDSYKYGINPESLELIRALYMTNEKNGKRNLNTSLNSDILRSRSSSYARSENVNKKGNDININLINDSLGYKPNDPEDSSNYYRKLKSNLLSDSKGNDLFFYLQDYYKQFRYLVDSVGNNSSNGGNNNGSNRQRDITIPENTQNREYIRYQTDIRNRDRRYSNLINRQNRDGVVYSLIDDNGDDKNIDARQISDLLSYDTELHQSARNARDRENNLFERLRQSQNISDKVKTIISSTEELVNKPVTLLASVLQKADEHIYNILYSDTGDEDEGFMDVLKRRLNETFDEVINKTEDTWDKIKDKGNTIVKEIFGHDFNDLKEAASNIVWGDPDENGDRHGGIIGDFARNTGTELKDMFKRHIGDPIRSWADRMKDDGASSNYARGGKVTKTGVIAVTGGEYIIPAPGNKKEQLRKENEAKRKFINYARNKGKGDNFDYLGNYADGNLDDPNGIPGEGRVVSIDEDDLSEHENILRQIIRSKQFTEKKGKNGKRRWTMDEDTFSNNDYLMNLILGNNINFSTNSKKKEKISDAEQAIRAKGKKVRDIILNEIPEKYRKSVSDIIGEAGENSGAIGAGAVVGGGVSLITGLAGGPILGAVLGSALSLIHKSEKLQNMLFKDGVDEDGNPTPGLLKEEEGFIKDKLPDIVKFGLGGRVLGSFIGGPILGPIIGTTLGAAIGYAKNTEEMKNAFFGKGAIAEGLQEKIKKALPKAGAGAIMGLLFSPLPFGLVGNAMVGAAIGFASDNEKFRDIMFGKKDKNGKRSGGIAGTLKKKFVDPLADFAKNYVLDTKTFFTEKVFKPIEDVMQPIAARVRNRKYRWKDKLKKKANKALKKIGGTILGRVARRGKKALGKVGDGLTWLATRTPMAYVMAKGGLLKLPFRAVGAAARGINTHMRNKDTREGYNDYEDIQDQLRRAFDVSSYNHSALERSTASAETGDYTTNDLFDNNGNINQAYLHSDARGSSLNALMNMDKDQREQFLNQMAFRQSAHRDVNKYLKDTYKQTRREALETIDTFGIDIVGESKIRKALQHAGEESSGGIGAVKAKTEEDFEKILRESLPWMKDRRRPTEEQEAAANKLRDAFKRQLEARKALDGMGGDNDDAINQMLSNMGISEGNIEESKEYLGRMASVLVNNDGAMDRVFGSLDRDREEEEIKNDFFADFTKGKQSKVRRNMAILNKVKNGEELDDNEKKILSKYIQRNIHNLDGNPKNQSVRNYLSNLNDDLTGRPNSLGGTQGNNADGNVDKIKSKVEDVIDVNKESRDYLSELLEKSKEQLNVLAELTSTLTGNESIRRRFNNLNNNTNDNNDIIFDDNGNPIINEDDIDNHAFGGKTSAGLAVVTKGEEITSKSEHLLSNIRDMLYKKFNEAEYVTTDRGGIVRLRRDANGEIVTDVRDKDTQASIENANQDTNLLKEISKKLDNVGFGGENKNSDNDENNDDKNDKDDDNNLLDTIKNIKDNITDWGSKLLGIGGTISSALTTIGGGIPEIVEAIDNIVVPVAATGALDEVAEEANPEEYKTYTDYSGNEFGESLSDRARWNLLKKGAYKLAGWDLNGPKKIGRFIGKAVRKRQTKKLLKKQDKARRLINEYKRLSDGVETTEDVVRTSRKINNIDDAIKYMDRIDNVVDGAENVTRTADNVSDISKASKKAVKAAKRAEKYEKSMNRVKNIKNGAIEKFNKYKDGLVNFLKKVANIIGEKCPKIKSIFEKFVEKIYKPLKDAFKKASESKLGKALKVVGKVLTIAMIFADFTNGCKKAGTYFRVTDDRVTSAMRIASGTVNCVSQLFLLTMFIPTDVILEAFISAAELVDADWAKDLRAKQEASQEDLQEYRDDVGDQTITMDEFNSRFYNSKTLGDTVISNITNYKNKKSLEKTIETKKQNGEDTSSEEFQLKIIGYQAELDSIANISANYDKDLENIGLKMYVKVFKSFRGALSKKDILKMNMKLDALVRKLIKSDDKKDTITQEFDKVYPKKSEPKSYLTVAGGGYKYEVPKNLKDLPSNKMIMAYGIKVNNITGTWTVLEGNIENLQGRSYVSNPKSTTKTVNNSKATVSTKTSKVTEAQTEDYNNSIIEMEKRDNIDYNGNFMIGSGSKLDTIQKKTGTFISQLDPSIANKKFTKNTTFGQNACGPAVASMIINSAKSNTIDIKDAAKFATVGKYANDQGTDSKYFKDLLGTYGIHTNYMDNTKGTKLRDIKEQIAKGNEVVLLGSDSKNKNKRNSPFGSSDHYVLATGIDRSGNIIVNDPESDRPMKYSSKILKNVKLGIGTDAIRGSGSFRGGTITNSNDVVDTDIAQKIYGYLTSNGYSPAAAAGIMGNLEQESHLDTGAVNGDGSNSTGIAQWKDGRLTAMQQNAASMGYDWHELDPQLDWLNKEINGADSTTVDKLNKHWGGLEAFKNTDDAAWAADAFMQSFERCKTDPNISNIAGRTKWAKQYYEMYSGTPYEGTYTPSTPTGAVSTDTGTNKNSDGSSFDFSNGSTDIISAIGSLFTDTILDGIKSSFGNLASLIGWDTSSEDGSSSSSDYTSGSYSSGESADLANLPKGDPNTIVAYAKSKINKLQYLYGSTDVDNGVSDCSGFAQWAVKKATGIDPGRDTGAMYTNSEGSDVSIGSLDESQLQPGDLLLYRRNNSQKIDGVGHVEIYEGNGKMIGNGGPNNGDIGATEKNVTNNNFLKAKRFVTYTPTESRTTSSYAVQDGYSHYMDSRALNNTETTTDTKTNTLQNPYIDDTIFGNNDNSNTNDTFNILNELNGSGSGLKSTLFTGSNSSSTNTNNSTIKTSNNASSNVKSNDYTRFSTSSSERSLLDAVMGKSTNNISSVVKALSEVIDRLATISTNTEINAKIYEVLVNYLKDMVNGNNTIIATNGNNSNNINASNNDSLKELSSLLNIIATK